MQTVLLLLFFTAVCLTQQANECLFSLPISLSFVEPLSESLSPNDVVIFMGGDSWERRQTGFGKISADSIEAFANHHGYRLIFIDDLNYNYGLKYQGIQFAPQWHKVFSMTSLRAKFPDAKYYVWMDDDIYVPYPETDMLNHYVNLMEQVDGWEMLFGEEGTYKGQKFVLNSGLFIMKNTAFTEWAWRRAMEIGTERDGFLAQRFGHDQGAVIQVRERNFLQARIRVLAHRDGIYNFNTFARDVPWDLASMKAKNGDAFVHFLGNKSDKEERMLDWIKHVQRWRDSLPSHCKYPVPLFA